MGEMADMALEHIFDIMEADDPGDPESDAGPSRSGPLIKTCKFCGVKGLVWKQDGLNKWRLSKDGIIHICKKYKK